MCVEESKVRKLVAASIFLQKHDWFIPQSTEARKDRNLGFQEKRIDVDRQNLNWDDRSSWLLGPIFPLICPAPTGRETDHWL